MRVKYPSKIDWRYLPGWLWAFIASFLGWVFFCVPNYLKGTFSRIVIRKDLSIIWYVDKESDFFINQMQGWAGFIIGCNIIMVEVETKTGFGDEIDQMSLRHETAHVYQNYTFGPLFYPVYILMTCFIYVFMENKHAYLDNPFERQARGYAGQEVNILQEDWCKHGSRWPWW